MPFSFPKILRRHSIVQALLASKLIQPEQTIKFNGNSQAFVNLSDPEPRNAFLKSVFEPDFFHVAKSFLRKGSSFFDLGANMGFCSFGLVPNYPDLSYHLFEANPQLIHLLKRSIELHPLQKFVLNHACISDRFEQPAFNWNRINQVNPMCPLKMVRVSRYPTSHWMTIVVSKCWILWTLPRSTWKVTNYLHCKVGTNASPNTESKRSTSKSCPKTRLGMGGKPKLPFAIWNPLGMSFICARKKISDFLEMSPPKFLFSKETSSFLVSRQKNIRKILQPISSLCLLLE